MPLHQIAGHQFDYTTTASFRSILNTKTSFVARIRERTIPTERPPLVSEVSADFCGYRVPCGQRDGSLWPYSRISRLEPLRFLSSSSSIVFTRLNGPLSILNTTFLNHEATQFYAVDILSLILDGGGMRGILRGVETETDIATVVLYLLYLLHLF
jgi:hypothetical protein